MQYTRYSSICRLTHGATIEPFYVKKNDSLATYLKKNYYQ